MPTAITVPFSSRAALAAAAVFALAGAATADVVFTTGVGGSVGGGQGLNANRFMAQPFRLLQPTDVTALSWEITGDTSDGVMSIVEIFAPGVYNNSTQSYTDPSRVRATGLYTSTAGPAVDRTVTFAAPTRLREGWYAAVVTGGSATNMMVPGYSTVAAGVTPAYSGIAGGSGSFTSAKPDVNVFGTVPVIAPDPAVFAYQSASRASNFNSTGFVTSTLFFGTRFEVTTPTLLTEMGAMVGLGGGSLFAAVVRLSGPGANPSTTDLSQDVVASALFDASGPLSDRSAVLDTPALMTPGSYAVVIGTGLFGANGSAQIPQFLDLVTPGASNFVRATSSVNFWSASNQAPRLFVSGVVPAPGSAALLLPLAGLALRRRRGMSDR
jgi:hypothetical protein